MPWRQTSEATPCPICGKQRYCTFKPEAGIVKCTQVSDGSFSQKRDKAGNGFFHKHDFDKYKEPLLFKSEEEDRPDVDWEQIYRTARMAPRHRLASLARQFGCTVTSINKYGIGWLSRNQLFQASTKCRDDGAWTFPMRNADEQIIGYRLRSPNGDKFSIKWSSLGLFFKPELVPGLNILVVDGASDAFTAHRYGLHAVGRPSSMTGQEELLELFKKLQPPEVHQLLDADGRDNPNLLYARQMAQELLATVPSGTIFYPPSPYKDLREWLTETGSLPNRFKRLVSTFGKIKRKSSTNPSPSH